MITLGIETSCDETAAAVAEDGRVLSSEVSSSVHLHSAYGGVIPEIASRYHVEYIYPVLRKALSDAGKRIEDVGLIAVTKGPGLPGSLLVGMAFAKAISYARSIPIIGVDHLKAHIVSCFIDDGVCRIEDKFPFIGMVISGRHTSIFLCRGIDDFEGIGRTRDDAVGEAFDKVAKVLELGYPGGPVVERRAASFTGEGAIDLPRALLADKEDLDFSFSGIKTAVLYRWRDAEKTELEKDRICSSFQEAVVDVVSEKAGRAMEKTGIKKLAVGGGVINNDAFRKAFKGVCEGMGAELYLPEKELCTDNAAMIAITGEKDFALRGPSDLSLKAEPVSM